MAMRDGAGTPLDPANLWGKPDPRKSAQVQTTEKEEKDVSRIDADLKNDEIDVDAALAAEDGDEADYENEFDPEEGDDDVGEDDVDAELEEEEEESDVVAETDADETAESDDDAVEDDEKEPPAEVAKTPATSSRKREMTDKKTSLSDHIRSEIARRQEAGEELRGKDIVTALASRRIKVSPAQVSQILKKEGLSSGTRGRKPKAAVSDGERSRQALKTKPKRAEPKKAPAAAPVRALPKAKSPAAANGFSVPMPQLQAAEEFVKACGGSFDAASRILTAAQQLSQTFGN